MTLTKRQLEMLRLAADGLANRQIADKLGISEQTVVNTFSLIYARCGAVNRAHAVAIAFRKGWLC